MTMGGVQYIGGHKLNGSPQRPDSRSKWPNRLMGQGPEGVYALIKPRVCPLRRMEASRHQIESGHTLTGQPNPVCQRKF
jgi:hypothetical protein